METVNNKLRVKTGSALKPKGSALTHVELDENFINIYNDFVALQQSSNVDSYSSGTTYNNTTNRYAVYSGVVWKWINATPGAGVTPGTDGTKWNKVFATDLAHDKNKDTKLAEGTTDEIAASNIMKYVEVTVSSAEILTGYASPVELIANADAEKYVNVIEITAENLYESVSPASAFYDGGHIYIRCATALENMFKFTDILDQAAIIRKGERTFVSGTAQQLVRGQGIVAEFNNGSNANPISGDFDIKFTIFYIIK